jgi:small neutral amino acid transporter SnatA (MarC family)
MKNDTISITELLIITALLLIFFLLLNPFGWWMPSMMLAGLLIIALAVFGLFAAFTVKEKHSDEREAHNRIVAGRMAFVAGTTVLALGMIVQSFHHTVDPWLFAAFVLMIVAKIGTRTYIDKNF